MRTFGEMTKSEQNTLYEAYESGRTVELYNANMDEWLVTHRPTFNQDMAYRIAETQTYPSPLTRG